jgi:hypothetical protein
LRKILLRPSDPQGIACVDPPRNGIFGANVN